jgi:hypothetical protein
MEEVIDHLLDRLKRAERRALHTARCLRDGRGHRRGLQRRQVREWGTVAALTLAIDHLRRVR